MKDFRRVDAEIAKLRAHQGLPSIEEARRQEEERAKVLRGNVRPVTVIKEEVRRRPLQYVPRIRATNISSVSSSMKTKPSNSVSKDPREISSVQKGPRKRTLGGEASGVQSGMAPKLKNAEGKTTTPKLDTEKGTLNQNHSSKTNSVPPPRTPRRRGGKSKTTNREPSAKRSKTSQNTSDAAKRRIKRKLEKAAKSKSHSPPTVSKETLNAEIGTESQTPKGTIPPTSTKRKASDLGKPSNAPLKKPKLKPSKPKRKPTQINTPSNLEVRTIWDPLMHQHRCGMCSARIESDSHCANGHCADALKPRTRSGVRIRELSYEELLEDEQAGPPYRVNEWDIDSEEDTRLVVGSSRALYTLFEMVLGLFPKTCAVK